MDITCYWIAWLTRMSSERWHVRSSLQISATIPSSQNHFKTLHTPPNPIKSNLRSNPFLFIVHRIPNSPDPSSIRFSRFLFFVSHFLPEREVLALISRIMFWRDRERENKELNGGVLCGLVRVLVVGDSGVGKTSLVNLIVKGSPIARPPQTIGCSVDVKDMNGVIFVHDLSQRRTKTSLQKWAAEIAATGTFSAPLGSGGPGGLPVPYIFIGNKADIAAKEGTRGSSGNLVDVARQWVEKQGLLPSSEELPLTESFPGNGGLIAAAKEARHDKEAVVKFFRMLIRRRYFSDEIQIPSPAWSIPSVQRQAQRIDENFTEDDQSYDTSLSSDPYKYNMLPPLPAQRNLTPPPTLYPQQPVSVSENYSFPRFSLSGSSEISTVARTKRSDINV
ncbi:hypothetical protein JHK85_013703 [Glycine max]|nr:hypothetical protein JHK85_013703 [Glycine max]